MELEIRPVFLVPDTNGFIDHLGSLVTLLDCRKFILVVPLIGECGQHEAGGLLYPPGRAPPLCQLPQCCPTCPQSLCGPQLGSSCRAQPSGHGPAPSLGTSPLLLPAFLFARWSCVSSRQQPALLLPVPRCSPACQLAARSPPQAPLPVVCTEGVPGAGRGMWVLNGIWKEFWKEQGGGIVKQSKQIAYPS